MDTHRISYTELSQTAKEFKSLALEMRNEINNINAVITNLENNPGIKSTLQGVSLSDSVAKITSTFTNYNNIIAKFANFLDEEVIKKTKEMQDEIRVSAKKWAASIETNDDKKIDKIA